jgi:nitrogen-specific signal transduction histidine kinase
LKLKEYHDIINSASVIRGMAELLMEEERAPAKKDMLSVIMNRAEKVAEQLSNSRDENNSP